MVIYSIDQKTQKFIPLSEMGDTITAVAMTPNKKFLAVAERGIAQNLPVILVYDLTTMRRRKALQLTEGESKVSFLGFWVTRDRKL